MLGAIFWSFVGAVICTLIISGISFLINRKDTSKYGTRIAWAIVIFSIQFVVLLIAFYAKCSPQTILTVVRWWWIALVGISFINFMYWCDFEWKKVSTELKGAIVVATVSGVISFVSLFTPVQNLIYAHDMKDVDVAYAISSDEVLAKVELKIDNAYFKEKYYFEEPEMRQVGGKNIAVYPIKKLDGGSNDPEYIPGYAIQEEGELPKIVSKRIYFDTSYYTKKDALRTIRRKYPTVTLGDHKFDIDDNWNPYEVYEYRDNLFYSNGEDYGIIVLNLMDGTSEKYPVAENKIPPWVDFKTTYPR